MRCIQPRFIFILFIINILLKPSLFALVNLQINDETFDKLLSNYERLMQRLTSLNFNSEDPANAEAYRQYERKMEISEDLTTRKKDLQKAKELVLTV